MRQTLLRLALACCLPSTACAQGAPAPTATALFARGDYREAARLAQARVTQRATDTTHTLLLVQSNVAMGQLRDALASGRAFTRVPSMAMLLGRVHERLGHLDDADSAYAVAERGPERLRATMARAHLGAARGAIDRAIAMCEAVASRGASPSGSRTASDWLALGLAEQCLGRTDPSRFKTALRYFDAAIAKDSLALDAQVALAEMFLEKFNGPDALATLQKVLARNPNHPGALLALTKLRAFEGTAGGPDPLRRLLTVDSTHAEGHALAARRMIDVERYDDAVTEARRGLVHDSTAPGPWTVIAAARFAALDTAGYRDALDRAHGRLPRSAEAEVVLADVAARNRLYHDAVRFATDGIARDPANARALALLGINQLRVGRIPEGTTALQRAFALDPYDVWVKNTLDFVDTFSGYRTIATPHTAIAIEANDADALGLFAAPLAEEAYAALSARYGYRPPGPIRVEVYRSHADFSVRTVGLAGLGALGVSFGDVVAMDSPAARAPGEFNWESVLWHELTHTFTLGATANRVPRWVSEGLSVYEERRACPAWGGGMTPSLIAAYKAQRVHPISRLNDGFMRPRYPEEVLLSYALSAYVFEMVEAEHGIDGIRQLLAGYRDGQSTAAVFTRVLGMDMPALDAHFDQWFRAKFSREFAAVEPIVQRGEEGAAEVGGTYGSAMREAVAAAGQQRWREVLAPAQRAAAFFPGFADEGSAYHLMAQAHTARGTSAAVIAAYRAIVGANDAAVKENIALADLLLTAGDSSAALAALDRAVRITPFDAALHGRIAALAGQRQAHGIAVRSRAAVVALKPANLADAHFQLARALAAAGDLAEARRSVLRALDIAPAFEEAQALLLSLPRSGTPR